MEINALNGYLAETCRYLILFTMCVAALGKVASYAQFRENLHQGFDIPVSWTGLITLVLIVSEATVVLLLVLEPRLRMLGMILATFMLVAFTLVLVWVLLKDRLVRCNCFGSNNDFIGVSDVVRNLLLISACFGYMFSDAAHSSVLPWHGHVLLVVLAVMWLMILSNVNALVLLSRDPKGAQHG